MQCKTTGGGGGEDFISALELADEDTGVGGGDAEGFGDEGLEEGGWAGGGVVLHFLGRGGLLYRREKFLVGDRVGY